MTTAPDWPQQRNRTLIRMFSLLRILHQSGARSVAQLSTELSVTRRTIYRDLNALEELHVPLVTKMNEWDGVRVVEYARLGSCPVCSDKRAGPARATNAEDWK